jgi:cyclopropane fatty-acyl-phospholipid synthase-like methyltransferase
VAVTRLGHVVHEDRPEDVPAWFRGEGRQARSFDDTYAGTPPWEIGRPQPALQVRADAAEVRGRVLDSGCGTGEHALMAAAIGLKATGIDSSPRAIALAEDKARERGLSARFLVHDVLDLGSLGEQFDTILDSGVYHVFDDDDRPRYVESLSAAAVPGARYFMLCFSDEQPGTFGPRRVSQDEIRESFAAGWHVDSIEAATMTVNFDPGTVRAWLAAITRL